MKTKFLAPLAALAALSVVRPAAAITFNGGDILNITGAYEAPAPTGIYDFHTAGGSAAGLGNYGNFGVQNDSTGAFSAFANGGTVTTDYEILSLDFGNVASYVGQPFLSLTSSGDAFTFEITEPAINQASFNFGSMGGAIFSFEGVFKSADDRELGQGVLSGQFIGGDGSYSASLTVVESVPEPSVLLGLGLMAGAVFVVRRRQSQPA